MSDWHFDWQSKFPRDYQEVVITKNLEKHRADIAVQKTIIEFQHSPLSPEEFGARNAFYTSCGYSVIWLFDLIEQTHNQQIINLRGSEFKYYWKYAKSTFCDFNIRKNSSIKIYFQISEQNDPDSGTIIDVVWASPSGFKYFAVNNYYSENEFVEMFLKNSNQVLNSNKHDIDNHLHCILDDNGAWRYYGCPLSKEENPDSPFVIFEKCCKCIHFRGQSNSDIRYLRCGFHNKIISSLGHIQELERSIDGFITKVVYKNDNSTTNTHYIESFPCIAKNLEELWSIYRCDIMRCRNLRNGYHVQVFNPSWQLLKNGAITGKTVYQTGELSKHEVDIFGGKKREWIITWFKRNK